MDPKTNELLGRARELVSSSRELIKQTRDLLRYSGSTLSMAFGSTPEAYDFDKEKSLAVKTAAKKIRAFDPQKFLATIGEGRKVVVVAKKQAIFAQRDAANAVFYIQKGKVKLTVVSKIGKEATIGILSEGSFFGEGCLAGQQVRMVSATAMADSELLRIEKNAMMDVLHREHALSDVFVAYLLTGNIRYEEDLVDQLFNSSENDWRVSFCCSPVLARKDHLKQ